MGLVRQVSLFDDETGEFISSNATALGSKLKEGWIVVYKDALMTLMSEVPNYATLRFYLYLACHQTYDTMTIVSTSHIAKEAGMTYQTAWNACKWLIQHNYIAKTSKDGTPAFIINPDVTTCGKKNLEAKMKPFINVGENAQQFVSDKTAVSPSCSAVPNNVLSDSDDKTAVSPSGSAVITKHRTITEEEYEKWKIEEGVIEDFDELVD